LRFFQLLDNREFFEAITYGTGDTARVLVRFKLWDEVLRDVANDHA
jgi:hypothetical protein